MIHSVFIGIDYDDAYKAVVVSVPPEGKETRFETGDPTADWRAAVTFAAHTAKDLGVPCMTLSSLDGFVFDVPGWRFDEHDNLERDPRDYNADGSLKTREQLDADDAAVS
jgi:hypothetical protein